MLPADWEPKERATLVYLRECDGAGERVLLIHKLRGHGAGKVNAPGGRIEPGETPERCARREVLEEVGVRCGALRLGAVLRFHDTGNGFAMLAYGFVAEAFSGTPAPSAEADPFWCGIDSLPFDRMWEDDRIWLPPLLAGRLVRGDLVFENDRLTTHEVVEVESLDEWR